MALFPFPLSSMFADDEDFFFLPLTTNQNRNVFSRNLENRQNRKNDSLMEFNFSGYDPKNIKIDVVGNMIQVEAKEEADGSFRYVKYQRNIPEGVSPSDLKATMKPNGLLSVKIPEVKPETVHIPISFDGKPSIKK